MLATFLSFQKKFGNFPSLEKSVENFPPPKYSANFNP